MKKQNIIIVIAAIASLIASITGIWNFKDRLVGEHGYIAINATVEENKDICLASINEVGLEVKKYRLEVINKEIRYFKERCGHRPLKGNCLKESEKIYYMEVVSDGEALEGIE